MANEHDCDNCWFCVNGQCERVGGCRYDEDYHTLEEKVTNERSK